MEEGGMADDRVNVAIIGAGWWGTNAHIPALKKHPQAECVAVQARTLDKARKIADDFGIPNACTTVEEVLALEGLDAVVISTTPNVHYDQARAALEHGKHVVIEKPMTITRAQAQELVDIAQANGLHFVISCPWHYNPHAVEARRLVESGALGQLKMVNLLFTNNVAGLYEGKPLDQAFRIDKEKHPEWLPYRMPGLNSYSDPAVAGGGHIYTQISHVAAMLGFITQSDPAEVFARFDNAGTAVDVFDAIDVKLANGALVSIASHGLPMPRHSRFEISLCGTQAELTVNLMKGQMTLHDYDSNVTEFPEAPGPLRAPREEPTMNLVDLILGKRGNGSPATLGLYAMKVIEAACQSAQTGQNVVVA
jgi:predicted dehydrogenase